MTGAAAPIRERGLAVGRDPPVVPSGRSQSEIEEAERLRLASGEDVGAGVEVAEVVQVAAAGPDDEPK
jgi:hypothetical protein